MAIELNITGRCEGCPALDLEITEFTDGTPPEAHCRNLDLCQHIERHIVENPYRGNDAWRFV